MIHNVLDNTPETWLVQIFIQPEWWQKEVLQLHRGLQVLINHPRINLTEIPKQYWRYKPKQIMTQNWFWESLQADPVFLFSGNGVMCAHSLLPIQYFIGLGLDFCGAPSRARPRGGDGSTHSIRNRIAMLDAIEYGKPDMQIGSESSFFTSTLIEMNKQTPGKDKYKLADKNETILFGGAAQMVTAENNEIRPNFEQFGPSLIMSGTAMNIPWEVRDSLLQICPEWKLIFPSLHEPACFGATPVADKCKASICALKPDRPKRGC